jgi:hypothetical protein
MNNVKVSGDRRFTGGALAETALPIPYDAAAMAGATVLGANGDVYVSVKSHAGDGHEWAKMITQGSQGTVSINIDTFTGGNFTLVVAGFGEAGSPLKPGRIGIAPGIEPPNLGTGLIGRLEFISQDQFLTASSIGRPVRIAVEAASPGWTATNRPCNMFLQVASETTTNADNVPRRLELFASGLTTLNGASGQRAFSLTPEGNVLIGNTTGTQKLSVTGNVQADGFLCGTTGQRSFTTAARGETPFTPPIQLEGTTLEESAISALCVGDNSLPRLILARARGTQASQTPVVNGDALGILTFNGYEGEIHTTAASITVVVDGTPGPDDLPGLLRFKTRSAGTTSVLARMEIDSDGHVHINNTVGTERLSVEGNIQLTNTANSLMVGTTAVVGSRKTGWGVPSGTASRATFVTSSVSLGDLAQSVKALIDDLTAHGLIGA